MSSDREDSPDWLRTFEAPTQSAVLLSSGSESPLSDDEDALNLNQLFHKGPDQLSEAKNERDVDASTLQKKPPSKFLIEDTTSRKRKGLLRGDEEYDIKPEVAERKASKKARTAEKPHHSLLVLSSDSETVSGASPTRQGNVISEAILSEDKTQNNEEEQNIDAGAENIKQEFLQKKSSKAKFPKKQMPKEDQDTKKKLNRKNNLDGENGEDIIVEKEDIPERQSGSQVASSKLPLVLSEKVQRAKVLVECEGDSIDLSGDVGAVGRVVISDDSHQNQEMLLDLKGTIYKTKIIPSRTFCVVSFGQSEAKIEAIMNDFIQLRPQSNVYEAETMVEGTLDGFSFDSENEIDNLLKSTAHPDENEPEQSNGVTKRKSEKSKGERKKGKTAGGSKQPKVLKRKSQATKKSRAKK